MNITQDIQDAINKNLPQAVGDTLRTRLDQADQDANDLANLRTRYGQLQKLHDNLADSHAKLEDALGKHKALDAREQAVSKRERDADLHAMTVRATQAEINAQFAKDVALGLVRNTEYRTTVHNSYNKNVPGPNGYSVPENGGSTNTTTTQAV